MQKKALTQRDTFYVRESSGLNFIIAGLCWFILLTMIFTWSEEFTSTQTSVTGIAAMFALAAAIFFTIKSIKRKECMRMNAQGFFYNNRLITTWDQLESAQVTEENKIVTVKDNFVLILKYSKDNGSYMRKIALTNTQDKSEEEILAAIKFYGGVTKALPL